LFYFYSLENILGLAEPECMAYYQILKKKQYNDVVQSMRGQKKGVARV